MEAGSPGVMDKESVIWVITMSPLDPEVRGKFKDMTEYHKTFS
jgi:hypothetical protein